MAKNTMRRRNRNWSHEETLNLALGKRDASLSGETGDVMWQKISSRFPDPGRSDEECRNRWDTLVKIDNKIKKYCRKTGKEHRQLNDKELAPLKLGPEFRWEWYDIVREVCSPSKRTEASALPMPSQASTSESSSADNVRRPSSEVSKLSPEEETEQAKERLEDEKWADDMVRSPTEDEQVQTEIVPAHLESECPSHNQQYGAVNIAGALGDNLYENFGVFSPPPWNSNDANAMDMYMSQVMSKYLKISTVPETASRVSEGTISRQASGRNDIILQSESEEDQHSEPCALPVIELKVILCCESCIRKLRRKLEALNGVEKPVIFDRVNMKVSVTATAEPEDVLKQVQMVKKTAAMWPSKVN